MQQQLLRFVELSPESRQVRRYAGPEKDLVSSRASSPLLPKPQRTSTGSKRRKIPQQDAIGGFDRTQGSTCTTCRCEDVSCGHGVESEKGRPGDKEGYQTGLLMFVFSNPYHGLESVNDRITNAADFRFEIQTPE